MGSLGALSLHLIATKCLVEVVVDLIVLVKRWGGVLIHPRQAHLSERVDQ
jgi:hypothetical protein